MRPLIVAALLSLVAPLSGCAARVGPVISQIQPLKDGGARVRRCDVYITSVFYVTDGVLDRCEWVTVPPTK